MVTFVFTEFFEMFSEFVGNVSSIAATLRCEKLSLAGGARPWTKTEGVDHDGGSSNEVMKLEWLQ